MKIAVFCPGYGRIPRGIETVVHEIFSRLHKYFNYKIDIYTGAKPFKSDFANIISVPVIKFQTKPALFYSKIAKKLNFTANEPYDFDFGIFAITSFMKSLMKKYDIIFNESGLYMQYLLNIHKTIHKTPVIHSGHAGINKLEFKIARLNPNVYLASSPYAYKEIKKRWGHLDVRVLPNGVNIDDNTKIDLKLPKPVILYVGALEPYKRTTNLIKAFNKYKNGSLIIIGTGSEKNKIRNIITQNNIQNVKMIDYVSLENLQKYFNSSDLFVLPSKNETFGIVYLNAMAANIPVIADNHPIQKWILNDAGFVCNCGNIDELALTIKKALNTNLNNKPIERARFFSWDKCSECYHKLINELILKKDKYVWESYWK